MGRAWEELKAEQAAKVLPFTRPLPPEPESMSGPAVCMNCRHRWIAVSPVGEVELECPACQTHRGVREGKIVRPGMHWFCHCGNDLFHATPDGLYCPSCGDDQEGWAK